MILYCFEGFDWISIIGLKYLDHPLSTQRLGPYTFCLIFFSSLGFTEVVY
jgi:hypothetical protein